MHIGHQLHGLSRKLQPLVVLTENKISQCHSVPGYCTHDGQWIERQPMLEALDRPFGLITHQGEPSPAVPIRDIVGIELAGVLDQRVRAVILPTGVAQARSRPSEHIAVVWCELAGTFSKLDGFAPLGGGKWSSPENDFGLDGEGEADQRSRMFRIEVDSSSKPVLRFGSGPF